MQKYQLSKTIVFTVEAESIEEATSLYNTWLVDQGETSEILDDKEQLHLFSVRPLTRFDEVSK